MTPRRGALGVLLGGTLGLAGLTGSEAKKGKGKGKGGGSSSKGDSTPRKGKGKGKDVQCYKCGKWGHTAQNCWSTQQVQNWSENQPPGLPASSSKGSPAPSVAAVMSVRIFQLTRRTKPSKEIKMMFDTGAATHVCPPSFGS